MQHCCITLHITVAYHCITLLHNISKYPLSLFFLLDSLSQQVSMQAPATHPPGLNVSEWDNILKARGVCRYHQLSGSTGYEK
jgi:hypothetical protein